MAEEIIKVIKGTPPKDDLDAYRGDTFISDVYRFEDDAGNPIDISGYTFEFEVRFSGYQNTGAALIKASASNFLLGQSDAADAAGVAKDEVVIKIDEEDMEVVSGKWVYDFRYTDGSGDREAGVKGKFTIHEDVSNLS